jgi:hypothetical protein
MKDAVLDVLKRGGYLKVIGEENVLPHGADSIAVLYPKLDAGICRRCTARIFPQCSVALPNGMAREVDHGLVQCAGDCVRSCRVVAACGSSAR